MIYSLMSARKLWTPEVIFPQEDNAIKHLVEELGFKKWTLVCKLMKERFQLKGR